MRTRFFVWSMHALQASCHPFSKHAYIKLVYTCLCIHISIEKIGSALMGLMPPMGAPVRPSPVRPSRPSGRPSPFRSSRPSGRPARPSVRCRWNRQDMASIYIYIYIHIHIHQLCKLLVTREEATRHLIFNSITPVRPANTRRLTVNTQYSFGRFSEHPWDP